MLNQAGQFGHGAAHYMFDSFRGLTGGFVVLIDSTFYRVSAIQGKLQYKAVRGLLRPQKKAKTDFAEKY